MDLTSVKTIRNLLKSSQTEPSKRLGQNFLISRGAVERIIKAAGIRPDDVILEIGPGLGVLTQELAKRVYPVKSTGSGAAKPQFNRAGRVIAVEKDLKMVEILKETLKDYQNIEIINGDIRFLSPKISQDYKIVGNLPFYLTALVIRKFLESERRPKEMILVVQKEVAQRICAKTPKMNLLAVSVQFYAEPKIISYISKNSFWPSPEVDAAIIKITPSVKPDLTKNKNLFFKIVKAGFSQPRKQLANNLSKKLGSDKNKIGEWLLKNNIRPSQRAETLSVSDWINLAKNYKIDL